MRFFYFIISGVFVFGACQKTAPITTPWTDNFNRNEIGADYHNTGGPYKIEKGELKIKGAFNKPLWLKKALPENAIVEFDVRSDTPDGDIKIELWGDGKTFATHKGAYLASSYVFIAGGWGNSISALCRLDEHGNDRKERRDFKVVKGKTYHFKIERKGSEIKWSIDGNLFLTLNDTAPLKGENHRYLGFNNWNSALSFDNLKITPL